MSNKIIVKNGENAPDSLAVAELGFDTANDVLYIGSKNKGLIKVGASGNSGIYVQNEEPNEAPVGTLWVDTDENVEENIDDTLTKSGFAADAYATGQRINAITPTLIGALPTYEQGEFTDADTIYDAGLYLISGGVNTPTQYGTLLVLSYRKVAGNNKTDYCAQLYIPTGDNSDTGVFYRTSIANAWNPWNKLTGRVLDSKSYGTSFPSSPVTGQIFYKKV